MLQKQIKAFMPWAGQAATQSFCWPGHQSTIRRAGRGRAGCCHPPTKSAGPSLCLLSVPTEELFLQTCQSVLV